MLAAAAFTLLWHLHHRQLPPCQQQQHSSLVKQKTFFSTVKKAGWLTGLLYALCSLEFDKCAQCQCRKQQQQRHSISIRLRTAHTAQHLKDTDCEAGEKEKFIVAQLRFKWTCSTVRIRSFFAFFALKCIQCTVLLRPLHRYYSSVPLFSLLLFYFSPAPEKEPYTRIKLLLLLQAEDASSTAAEAAPIQPGKQCDWSSRKRKRERERQCTSANISSSSSINFSISSKWSSGEQSSRERVGNKCLPWLTGWQWLWQRRLLSKLKLWLWWSLPGSQLSLLFPLLLPLAHRIRIYWQRQQHPITRAAFALARWRLLLEHTSALSSLSSSILSLCFSSPLVLLWDHHQHHHQQYCTQRLLYSVCHPRSSALAPAAKRLIWCLCSLPLQLCAQTVSSTVAASSLLPPVAIWSSLVPQPQQQQLRNAQSSSGTILQHFRIFRLIKCDLCVYCALWWNLALHRSPLCCTFLRVI